LSQGIDNRQILHENLTGICKIYVKDLPLRSFAQISHECQISITEVDFLNLAALERGEGIEPRVPKLSNPRDFGLKFKKDHRKAKL
jgi:hypothetical protein